MRLRLLSALVLGSLPALAAAEDVNLNNHADTSYVSLSAYSVGPSIGVVGPLSGDLDQISGQFLSLSLAQSVRFREQWDMGVDIDLWVPGNNWGGDLTVSYVFGQGAVQPFLGAGAGIRSLDYDDQGLGKGLGAEGLVQAGVYIDVLDNLQMRVRVPYRYILNSHRDQAAGLDIAMLFSSPLRKTKVKKLTY